MVNSANTDFVQATIEIFGAVIILVMGVMFLLMTGRKRTSEKYLFRLLVTSSLSLLLSAGWYIYDGNVTPIGFAVNWVCNAFIFILNTSLVFFVNGYCSHLILESGGTPKKGFGRVSCGLGTLALLIPLSNLLYKWMYYIDDKNVYHRLPGWYLFTVLNGTAIVVLLAMVIVQRNAISRQKRITLYVLLLSPFIGIALQSFHLGISFIQLGMAVGSLAVMEGYLSDWIIQEKKRTDISESRKNFWLLEGVFLIMILCVSAAVISCVISVKSVSDKESKQNSLALGHMVSETINDAIAQPINVSRTMAQSKVIIDALSQEHLAGTQLEQDMVSFMNRIQEAFGYQMVFVASERTRAYYTYHGFSRTMDEKADGKDAWYNEFRSQNIPFELNIDTDKDTDMSLAVFVNMDVRDENGQSVGVCGVAMSVENLMNMLSDFEVENNLNISLVNKDGLIQISTDGGRIEQDAVDISGLYVSTEKEFVYRRDSNQAFLTKYLEALDWYLVIEDHNPDKINVFQVVLPSMIIYVVGITLMMLLTLLLSMHEQKRNQDLRLSRKTAETDGLTRLKNRYAMERHMEAIQKNGFPEPFSVAMIDLNGLKMVNDTIGHAAGDELIIGTAQCLREVFQTNAETYRIGGDEFLVMCTCDDRAMEERICALNGRIHSWRGSMVSELSLSIGVASHAQYPMDSIEELIKEADRLMYQNKTEYYLRTGRKHWCVY